MANNLSWSVITEYISSKSPDKKGLTLPFDKFGLYKLNIYHTKWIDKAKLPKYIRNFLKGEDYYVAWLDNANILGNPFIYKERKADFEIEFKQYLNNLVSKYQNKFEINEDLLTLNKTVEIPQGIEIGIFNDNKSDLKSSRDLEDNNFVESKENYDNFINTNRYNKLSEVYLHEKILDSILTKGDFNEIKYVTLNPNLDWNLQKKLLRNQPEEDNFKLILSRQDVSPEILDASLKSKRYKKYALLHPTVNSNKINSFVDSINKLTDRDEIKAVLKNPNITEVAIRKIFQGLNKLDQREFLPLLKGKTLAQLEKNNLIEDVLNNKHIAFNIISQTPYNKSQFESYLIPYYNSLEDIESKKMFLLGIIQNPYVKLPEVKNFVKDLVLDKKDSLLLTTIEKSYILDLIKKYEGKISKENLNLFSYNIDLEDIEASINSREVDGIARTGFSYKIKDNMYLIAFNTKWFTLKELDERIQKKIIKHGKDLYISFTSSSFYFPGSDLLDEKDINVYDYKDEFVQNVKNQIKRLSSGQEIKNKEPVFELKSSVVGKEREIDLTTILKSTGYYFNFNDKANLYSNQALLNKDLLEKYFKTLKSQIDIVETDIDSIKKKILDFFNLNKSRPLDPTKELNSIKKTDTGNFFLNYTLNGEDIVFIRTRMKPEDFVKVFSITYSLESSILKGLMSVYPELKSLLKDYSSFTSSYVKLSKSNAIDSENSQGKDKDLLESYKNDIGIELRKEFDVDYKTIEDLQLGLDSLYLIRNILDSNIRKTLSNYIYICYKEESLNLEELSVVEGYETYKFQNKDIFSSIEPFYNKVFLLKDSLYNFLKKSNETFSEEIFEQRKVAKIKELLEIYKSSLIEPQYKSLYEQLEKKVFLSKEEFDTFINESITNTKGLYTLKNLGGYDDLIKEIIKDKRAEGNFTLRFDDKRHYLK